MEPDSAAPNPTASEATVADLFRTGAAVRLGHSPDPRARLLRLRVRRLMRPPPPSVDPEMTVAEVAARMGELGARWLPVIEHGRLVGIVDRRDLELASSPDPSSDPLSR